MRFKGVLAKVNRVFRRSKEYIIKARRTTYGQGVYKFWEASYIQGEFNFKEDLYLDKEFHGCLAIRLEGVGCPKEYIMARRTTYGKGVSKFREASYIQGEFNCKEDRELSNKARRCQVSQGVYNS